MSSTVDTHDIFGDGSCVATWQLDGDATDLGGNYDGTVVGTVTYPTGKFGQAIEFDEANDEHIAIGAGISAFKLSAHTISAWVGLETSAVIDVETGEVSYETGCTQVDNYARLAVGAGNGAAAPVLELYEEQYGPGIRGKNVTYEG